MHFSLVYSEHNSKTNDPKVLKLDIVLGFQGHRLGLKCYRVTALVHCYYY